MNIFEKYINSKLYIIVDTFLKLTIVNLLFLITTILGVGIFTFMPSLIAVVLIVKNFNTNHTFNIIKVYFNCFIKNYLKAQKLFVLYLIMFVIVSFNCYYFYLGIEQIGTLFYVGSFILMVVLLFCLIISFMHSTLIFVTYQELSVMRIIKNSFVFVPGFFIKNFIVFFIWVTFVIVSIYFPPFAFICSISLFNLIIIKFYQSSYNKIPIEDLTCMDIITYE